ncbi:MAG: CTP synthase [Patescibacteria group bacterium]|nr:CTP synthase [Patescibacteria group bacterium]MCL5258063.1 CTP synthase [Patescibacteria group bacterium]
MKNKKLKYIFVAGGVMSGVGKGVSVSSIAKIIQWQGLKVTCVKIDPYVNVDAGTMNPTEHGEVFVLSDGLECDQDMGNYERFLGENLSRSNYLTTGSIYLDVIKKERALKYDGRCVEVVPHIPLAILAKINQAAIESQADVIIVEIGGTVGEYQNILFLEAIRILKTKKPADVVLALVSWLPYQGLGSELKTKPTQYAVRTINAVGLQPDVIIARAAFALDQKRKEKIAFNCNLKEEEIISAPDIKIIYEAPLNFERDNLGRVILKKLNLKKKYKKTDRLVWSKLIRTVKTAKAELRIGVVGKYFASGNFILSDSYISVIEAIKHAAYFFKRQPIIEWLSADDFDPAYVKTKVKENLLKLKKLDGVIVPGGFGSRAVEGKINAIRFCRENKIPFFGLCYGMQLMVIEFARHLTGLNQAQTTEIDPATPAPVIDILPEQKNNLTNQAFGATMRLGSYPAILAEKTIAAKAYGQTKISERHRHRYEVNPAHVETLTKAGLIFSGFSPDKRLMEIAELPKNKHPFFLGVQFHPEFQSYPLKPQPLFKEFIRACLKRRLIGNQK